MHNRGLYFANAFNYGGANVSTYGPHPYSKVEEWARQQLATNGKVGKIYIASLESIAERPKSFVLTPYSPGNEEEKKAPTIIEAHSTGGHSPPVYTSDPLST